MTKDQLRKEYKQRRNALNLEETLESLSYALSYERSNTMALCLMGRIYAEQLKNFEQARNYFLDALTHNVYAIEIYPHYI